MLNDPPDFVPEKLRERLQANALVTQTATRTARVLGRRIGYRLVPEPLCVLVVDDDHDNANSLSMLISLWGHDVGTVYGGSAGLDAVAYRRPDVMFVDIAMPVITGLELARVLRRQPRFDAVWLIALTGYADDNHRLLCEAAGFDSFLVKPVQSSVLEQSLALARGPRHESTRLRTR